MNKLAITGITGKNGKILFDYLLLNENVLKEKWSGIKFLVRNKEKATFLFNADFDMPFEIIEGDLNKYGTALTLLNGCDTVLHISGIPYSINIVKAGVASQTKRFILVHTTGIYSKFKAAGENYRQIEEEVKLIEKENHLAVTILRPTMIYGTMNDHNISVFVNMVDKYKFIPVINGAHYDLQPVNCRDLGRAFYQVLMKQSICDGKEYILSGERPVELRELFMIIAKELGVKRYFVSCPFPIAYAGACVIYLLSGKRKDYREKVQRMCESRAYSHQNAVDDFGYSPMKIEDGIREEVKLFMDTGVLK